MCFTTTRTTKKNLITYFFLHRTVLKNFILLGIFATTLQDEGILTAKIRSFLISK